MQEVPGSTFVENNTQPPPSTDDPNPSVSILMHSMLSTHTLGEFVSWQEIIMVLNTISTTMLASARFIAPEELRTYGVALTVCSIGLSYLHLGVADKILEETFAVRAFSDTIPLEKINRLQGRIKWALLGFAACSFGVFCSPPEAFETSAAIAKLFGIFSLIQSTGAIPIAFGMGIGITFGAYDNLYMPFLHQVSLLSAVSIGIPLVNRLYYSQASPVHDNL